MNEGRKELYDRIIMGDYRENGDCTCSYYNCRFRGENPTLGEFISLLLKGGEWGEVEIGEKWSFNRRFEYRWGEIVSDTFTEQEKSRKIELVKMYGGWSMMNYLVNFTEDETDKLNEQETK